MLCVRGAAAKFTFIVAASGSPLLSLGSPPPLVFRSPTVGARRQTSHRNQNPAGGSRPPLAPSVMVLHEAGYTAPSVLGLLQPKVRVTAPRLKNLMGLTPKRGVQISQVVDWCELVLRPEGLPAAVLRIHHHGEAMLVQVEIGVQARCPTRRIQCPTRPRYPALPSRLPARSGRTRAAISNMVSMRLMPVLHQ